MDATKAKVHSRADGELSREVKGPRTRESRLTAHLKSPQHPPERRAHCFHLESQLSKNPFLPPF